MSRCRQRRFVLSHEIEDEVEKSSIFLNPVAGHVRVVRHVRNPVKVIGSRLLRFKTDGDRLELFFVEQIRKEWKSSPAVTLNEKEYHSIRHEPSKIRDSRRGWYDSFADSLLTSFTTLEDPAHVALGSVLEVGHLADEGDFSTEKKFLRGIPRCPTDVPLVLRKDKIASKGKAARFGEFGGAYAPEAVYEALEQLTVAYRDAQADPAFQKEFRGELTYSNRPSQLHEAKRLTAHCQGARIWFKREDLNFTGSHKINNVLGQILLARRTGKSRIIADTATGQTGVATAAMCAKFGLDCVIYIGEKDVQRQSRNVSRMQVHGAKIVTVTSGNCGHKEAINEAIRDWVTNLTHSYYLVGSSIGPAPFPTIVRDFQRVIGDEVKAQMLSSTGSLPDAVIACVGGGSNAIGAFYPFIPHETVKLVGVEAAGKGLDTGYHSATLAKGRKGVFQGVYSYVLQSKVGQIEKTHSIAAGLDYAGVGPEHAWLYETGRGHYCSATDEQAVTSFVTCAQLEGILPSLEASHAIWAAMELAKDLPPNANIVVTISGRGDKDLQVVNDSRAGN